MPLVPDYDPNEDDDAGGGFGGGGSGGGGGGAAPAAQDPNAPSKQREPAFVPWSRFVNANQEVSQREAGKLATNVENQAKGVQSEIDKAGQQQATDIASNYAAQPAESRWGSLMREPQAMAAGAGREPSTFATDRAQQQQQALQPQTQSIAQPQSQYAGTKAVSVSKPAYAPRVVDPNKLQTDVSSGAPKTAAAGLAGGKSLEDQVNKAGAGSWDALLGRADSAQQAADSLGSESGVGALLKQNYGGQSGSAFDSALVGGAGGKQFEQVQKQYGGNALDNSLAKGSEAARSRWGQLTGDVNAASSARDAEINAFQRPMPTEPGEATPYTSNGFKPEGFESYDDFKTKVGGKAGLHDFGTDISPADAIQKELGKAGLFSGNTVAEEFRKGIGAKDDLDNQNRVNAFKDIESEYGSEAAQYLWQYMTQDIWDGMAGQNAGAITKTLKDLVESAIRGGAIARPTIGNSNKKSEVQAAGHTAAEPDQGTTAEEETERTNAYRDGWGSAYDEQFRNGNRKPVNPNG